MGRDIHHPFILINLKTYLEAVGKKAEELAKIAEKVSYETGICIGLAPNFTDISRLSTFNIPVFSQHIDPVEPGPFTGHILAESVAEAGATGTIVNHSEKRLKLSDIEVAIERAKDVGLATVVCANTTRVGIAVAAFAPSMVAIEPPELIGTGIAVSKAKPEVVSNSVREIKKIDPNVKVLCGAGIVSGRDVYAAIKLGSNGILVASGVIKAPNWENSLLEFAKAAADASGEL
ncbi:MAG: triose-phosphate isomerase [Candidatus Bathyarchaeia archaeon]